MRIVTTLCAAASLLSGVWATSALAEELSFANFMPPGHPYVAGAFQPFADRVAEKTGGEVTVKLYNGGELGPGPVEQVNRAMDGVADFAISLPGYTASSFPLTLSAELPGVTRTETGTQDLWDNIDLLKGEYRRVELVSLWSSAPNVLYTRDKAVRAPEDVKGMNIRVPSRNAGLQVEAWGANPVSMPVTEIYNAMQTGVIDGAMIDTTATRPFRLGEVAKFLTLGFDATNSPFFIVANRDAFGGLSDDQQAAVLEAGKEASFLANQTQLKVAEGGIAAFEDMGGEVIRLSDAEAEAFNTLSAPIVGQVVAETGAGAQAIVDAMKAE
ncbi:TRAP transporter substrate-binding protein [Sagittula sp. S175]|uniref:TRAP transporter substrate-binding protein n=1 Tax=Sagittula sp. S175 TaxID=3415129 RepID=UPI003C7DA3C8